MITIELQWPNKILNPNNKRHWATEYKARKKQKNDAFFLAKSQPIPALQDSYQIEITFYPPDNRRRDEDNAIASLKGAIDGIALAWGVDDSKFRYTQKWAEKVKGGKITFRLL